MSVSCQDIAVTTRMPATVAGRCSVSIRGYWVSNANTPTNTYSRSRQSTDLRYAIQIPAHAASVGNTDTMPKPIRSGASSTLARAGSSFTLSSQTAAASPAADARSEEHTSELQSRVDLVCRLL